MVDLFGDVPEKPKAPVHVAVDAFYAGYVRRFNGPEIAERLLAGEKIPKAYVVVPVINGRGTKELKVLVEAWGVDRVVELIGKFFASSDPRVTSCYGSNYSMRHFCQVAEYLQISSNGRGPIARRTAETAHEVNQAIGARRRER